MLIILSILAAFACAYLFWQWRTGDLVADRPWTAPPPSLRRVTRQRLDCAGRTPVHRGTVANR